MQLTKFDFIINLKTSRGRMSAFGGKADIEI